MDSNKEMIIKQFTRWNILNFIETITWEAWNKIQWKKVHS